MLPLRPKRFRHRQCLAALLLLAAMTSLAPALAEESGETIRLAAGADAVVALTENPSTGYRWRLNGEASSNLALVAIADAGFSPGGGGKPLLGAPGTRRFRITARRPGTAVAVLEYARPWERVAAIRRHVVTIDIAGP